MGTAVYVGAFIFGVIALLSFAVAVFFDGYRDWIRNG